MCSARRGSSARFPAGACGWLSGADGFLSDCRARSGRVRGACWGGLCGGAAILGAMPRATERPSVFAARAKRPAHPPERVVAGPLVLRKMRPEDAGVIAAVVGQSLDHLRPWMPWANRDAADQRTQLARIIEADELWESGTDYIYAICAAGDGAPDGAN